MVYIAFAMAALAFILIAISRAVPIREGIPGTATQAAFENIFGAAALMYIASLIAFLCGSLLDIVLFGFFKRLTGGKMIWLRATGSTVISQLFDSFVVTFTFFLFIPLLLGMETKAVGWIFGTALTGYILKFVLAVLVTPFIYLGRWMIREWFGLRPLPATGM
ncbi:MAG: queuosine precursor transporter [Phycisphaeraceae bacterium]|nr:queuosine precursor transporter [Phycisphaeraceae bacterium]